MKSMMITVLATVSLLLAGYAGANQSLAQKSGCMACHGIDKAVLGPSFKDVAAKYRGQKDAEAKLVEKVKKGGSGVWGPIPMPANSPMVKDEDIKTLVKWVLTH